MAKSDGSNYFKRTSLFWVIIVVVPMSYFTCTVFIPEKMPFESLRQFGTFCQYLVDNYADLLYKGWWATLAIHLLEACVALRLCSTKGIDDVTARFLWFFQTFFFGLASLGLLIQYNPERPKQQ